MHDLRHIVATELAQKEIDKALKSGDNLDRKTLSENISEIVGNKLGNNPSQALKTYIDPQIWKQLT